MMPRVVHLVLLLPFGNLGCSSNDGTPQNVYGTPTSGSTVTTSAVTSATGTGGAGIMTTGGVATQSVATASGVTSTSTTGALGVGGASTTTTTASVSSTGTEVATSTTGAALPTLDDCPAAPAGASAEAVTALNTENTVRLAMGLDCAELVPELILAAQNHCDYYVQNQGTDCEAASPHNEVDGCPGFTGVNPGDRMSAAGYTARGGSETMAFANDPVRAVTMFIDSVYHRTPILNPWMRHLGYGGGDSCDTIDFGTGPASADDVTATYPYAGQVDVPVSFDGSREGPEPPVPSTGWPSGYPVTLFGQDLTVVSHAIYVNDTMQELPHLWLDESDPTLPSYAKVLYAEAPLEPMTTYRVVITTTRGGQPLDFDFTFTTGAASSRGF